MDIALTIKKLVEGIGDTELDKIANVIVDRYSKVKGIDYILIPKDKTHQSTFVTATKKVGKKPTRWAKSITYVDYDAKPNGYALVGEWVNVWELDKAHTNVPIVANINGELCVGNTEPHNTAIGVYQENGNEFKINHFKMKMQCAGYPEVIQTLKDMGVRQKPTTNEEQ